MQKENKKEKKTENQPIQKLLKIPKLDFTKLLALKKPEKGPEEKKEEKNKKEEKKKEIELEQEIQRFEDFSPVRRIAPVLSRLQSNQQQPKLEEQILGTAPEKKQEKQMLYEKEVRDYIERGVQPQRALTSPRIREGVAPIGMNSQRRFVEPRTGLENARNAGETYEKYSKDNIQNFESPKSGALPFESAGRKYSKIR